MKLLLISCLLLASALAQTDCSGSQIYAICAYEIQEPHVAVNADAADLSTSYVWTPDGTGTHWEGGQRGESIFLFYCSSATSVTVKIEGNAPTGNSDSFFVAVDDEEPRLWHYPRTSGWHWKTFGSSFSVSEGSHKLRIQEREDGTKMRAVGFDSGKGQCSFFEVAPGMNQQKYNGYYSDNFGWFSSASKSGGQSVVTSIVKGDEGSHYSYKWWGYFCPLQTGTYSFQTGSDDASHVVIGGTTVVNNGGAHPVRWREGSLNVGSTVCQDIVIYFGEREGGASITFKFKSPSDDSWTEDFSSIIKADHPSGLEASVAEKSTIQQASLQASVFQTTFDSEYNSIRSFLAIVGCVAIVYGCVKMVSRSSEYKTIEHTENVEI